MEHIQENSSKSLLRPRRLGSIPLRLCAFACGLLSLASGTYASDELFAAFQNPGHDATPITRWWWKGNDPTREEIVRQLDVLRKAGISGVHIMPLDQSTGRLKWLSPEWWGFVRFAADEAKKRQMQVDITAAYGWPCSGTFVRPEHRLQAISCFSEELTGPKTFNAKIDDILAKYLAGSRDLDYGRTVLAKNIVGDRSLAFARLVPKKLDRLEQVIDLAGNVRDGTLSFDIPPGEYVLYVGVHRLNAAMKKKSGEPGDFMLDYFDKQGVQEYMDHFVKTYHDSIGGRMSDAFHAIYISSPELWPANWTTAFAKEFQRRRGYDLMPYAQFALCMYNIQQYQSLKFRPDQFTPSPRMADVIRRVRYDYSKTLVELYQENFLVTVQQVCRDEGVLFRHKGYGFPWNFGIGENYLMEDIPEGNNWLIRDVPEQDWEVWNKYASAGGHLTGKHLISCEAMTTSKGKFRETLDAVKRADDFNFITGITRSALSGFTYSPASAPPPGWYIYGTVMSEHNPWWPYFHYWTRYNSRVSQITQMGSPGVEIAILGPTADIWSDFGLNRTAMQTKPAYVYKLWASIAQQGMAADYLHERVIQEAHFDQGRLCYGPMKYNLLALCDVESLEPATALAIERYVQAGGRLVIIGKQPSRNPGLTEAAAKDGLVNSAVNRAIAAGGSQIIRVPSPADDVDLLAWTGSLLDRIQIEWETKAKVKMPPSQRIKFSPPSPKLLQVRYVAPVNRDIVFLSNQDAEHRITCRGRFPMGRRKAAWRWDPETGQRAMYPNPGDGDLAIDLAPGESLLLVFEPDLWEGPVYKSPPVAGGPSLAITGPWDVTLHSFKGETTVLRGQPLMDFVQSPTLKNFAGVVEYETTFDASAEKFSTMELLDLGKINGVSEAWLNGRPLGIRWYGLHHYPLAGRLKAGPNRLRVKVSTLLYNAVGDPKPPLESTGMPGPVAVRASRKGVYTVSGAK